MADGCPFHADRSLSQRKHRFCAFWKAHTENTKEPSCPYLCSSTLRPSEKSTSSILGTATPFIFFRGNLYSIILLVQQPEASPVSISMV